MTMHRFAVLILWACVASWVHRANSTEIYDNLTQPVSVNGSFSNGTWPALSFRTTAVEFILDSVTIPIWNQNLLTSGTITFRIYDTGGPGGTPGLALGATLGTISIAGISSSSYQNVTFSGLNRTLTANTNYWIVTQARDLGNVFYVGATNTAGGIVTGSLGNSVTFNGGASWSAPSTNLYVIGRVTAVPEPSTCVLSGLSVIAMVIAARSRSTKAAA